LKVFIPSALTPFPVQRGDSILHRVLKPGEPYLLTDSSGDQWHTLIQQGLAKGRIFDAESRPIGSDTHRKLVFFDGDIGDAVVVGPSVAEANGKADLGFVTPNGDWSLFPFGGCPIFEFPISLRQANAFDGWGEFNFRQKVCANPVEEFATLVGLRVMDDLCISPVVSIAESVGMMLPQTSRLRIALCLRTRSHYRSWYGHHATTVATGLVEAGFDCYFVGPLSDRVEFRKGGEECVLWGEGLYDLQGRFATVEEYVALLSNMDAVIAPDGGGLMIACALQKPALGLFWCTNGEGYEKYAPTLTCLNAQKECSPCWCVGDRPPCEERYCMATGTVDPEELVNAAVAILS